MKENSWIKIYRKFLDWDWFIDSKTVHVFIYLLIRANVRSGKFQNYPVKRGQVVTSYAKISQATGMSVSSVKRAMQNLLSTGEITASAYNKYSVITVVKYEEYQDKVSERTVKRTRQKPREPKKKVTKPTETKEYTPKWWETDIPKQAWGKFPTEEEWFSYAEEHRDEVLKWDMR